MGISNSTGEIKKQYNRWTIIDPNIVSKKYCDKILCRCQCGNIVKVNKRTVLNGRSKSCGCLQKETAGKLGKKTALNLLGKRFGRLLVLKRIFNKKFYKKSHWLCRCDCGDSKIIAGSSLTSKKTKSCSCLQKEMMAKRMYKPELTEQDRLDRIGRRVSNENIEWRTSVYKRDKYICQCCGDNNGGNLIAHHKNSWDWDKKNRYNVNNGITLCEKCHKKFHKIYSYGNNTKKEYDDFILKYRIVDISKCKPKIYKRYKLDLTGKTFNKLTVIKQDETKYTNWICKCECGKIKSINGSSIKRGRVKSCGCLQIEKVKQTGKNNLKSLIGKRFDKLIVKEKILYKGATRYSCVCDCGNIIFMFRCRLLKNKFNACHVCRKKEK